MPQNPTELLGSLALKRWADVFQRDLGVDVILFDTPPCLVVADSVVLSAMVDAHTVLVVQANVTRRAVALKAKERFVTVDREIVGTVLNAANPRDEEYYGSGYYSYYYEPDRLPSTKEYSIGTYCIIPPTCPSSSSASFTWRPSSFILLYHISLWLPASFISSDQSSRQTKYICS